MPSPSVRRMHLLEEFAALCHRGGLACCLDAAESPLAVTRIGMPAADLRRLRETFRASASLRLEAAPGDRLVLRPADAEDPDLRIDVIACEPADTADLRPLSTFAGILRARHDGPADAQAPVVPVVEFATIEAGMQATGGRVPFLVPACRELTLDAPRFRALLAREQAPLFGYDYTSDTTYETHHLAPLAALQRLQDGALDIIIVDAPIPAPADLLPPALHRRLPADPEGRALGCCYVMTPPRQITPFHADPEYGGGYMYLVEGEKFWWFVDPAHAPTDALVERRIAQILTDDDARLWGKVQVAQLRGGGFVYFPPGWSHRVFTYRPSFGIGGYIEPDADAPA